MSWKLHRAANKIRLVEIASKGDPKALVRYIRRRAIMRLLWRALRRI